MQENYADCNVRYKLEDNVISFTMGFKFLPRIGDVFQYNMLMFEVVNVQHHQVMENGEKKDTGADATLFIEIISPEKDLYKSNNSK